MGCSGSEFRWSISSWVISASEFTAHNNIRKMSEICQCVISGMLNSSTWKKVKKIIITIIIFLKERSSITIRNSVSFVWEAKLGKTLASTTRIRSPSLQCRQLRIFCQRHFVLLAFFKSQQYHLFHVWYNVQFLRNLISELVRSDFLLAADADQ